MGSTEYGADLAPPKMIRGEGGGSCLFHVHAYDVCHGLLTETLVNAALKKF